jgi:hypothetical protein
VDEKKSWIKIAFGGLSRRGDGEGEMVVVGSLVCFRRWKTCLGMDCVLKMVRINDLLVNAILET